MESSMGRHWKIERRNGGGGGGRVWRKYARCKLSEEACIHAAHVWSSTLQARL